ncbi:MAG: hypothetical protein IIB42_10130 [Candidatus Marinimicrobia bacterium]|nr:hypothetical protein [Candidatus Neomarinimicrobiota bacterium]
MTFLLVAFDFLRNSWIGKALAIAGGILMAVLLVFSAGGRAQRKKHKIKNLEEYIDLHKRADKTADQTVRDMDGISDDDLNRRLRDRGRLRD